MAVRLLDRLLNLLRYPATGPGPIDAGREMTDHGKAIEVGFPFADFLSGVPLIENFTNGSVTSFTVPISSSCMALLPLRKDEVRYGG